MWSGPWARPLRCARASAWFAWRAASVWPKFFREAGNHVTALCGARSDGLRILDAELKTSVDDLRWATDDGSFGFHGNVLQLLQSFAQPGDFGVGHVIGPIPMMKAVAESSVPPTVACFPRKASKASFKTEGTCNRKSVPTAIDTIAAEYRSRWPRVSPKRELAGFRVTTNQSKQKMKLGQDRDSVTGVKVRATDGLGEIRRSFRE